MRSSFFTGLFAAAAAATPLVARQESYGSDCTPTCMTDAQAQQVANNFKALIAAYSNETAMAVLTPDYTDYTDSVSELINSGCPGGPQILGQATFAGREAFMAGQGPQPAIPFNFLNMWHTCDTVIFRWYTTPTPNATERVTGIVVLETVYDASNAAQPFQIQNSYSEFNSGAWLVDLGVFQPTCGPDGMGLPPPGQAATPPPS